MLINYFSAWINQYLPTVFASHCQENFFFFLPPWYKYLDFQDDPTGGCSIPDPPGFQVPMDFLAIGIAIIDMLTRLAGLVIVVVIILAGVSYITAQGNAEKVAAARQRIYNGFIGLAIVFIAAGLVAFIGNRLN